MKCKKCGKDIPEAGLIQGLCYYCGREERGKGIPDSCLILIILFILLVPTVWAILKLIAVVKWILT